MSQQTAALASVSERNPHAALVATEVRAITRVPPNAGYTVVLHGDPKEIQGRAIAKLFLDHHFYGFGFSQRSTSPDVSGLCYGMHYTIAVGKNDSVFRLKGLPDCRSLGEFLAQEKVKIRSADDARLVSDAYSEIVQNTESQGGEKSLRSAMAILDTQRPIRCPT